MTEQRIDHVAEAMGLRALTVGPGPVEMHANILAAAQVHATLALVEQQRIVSLIALRQADSDVIGDFEWEDVDRDIREGLGL